MLTLTRTMFDVRTYITTHSRRPEERQRFSLNGNVDNDATCSVAITMYSRTHYDLQHIFVLTEPSTGTSNSKLSTVQVHGVLVHQT